VDAAERRGRPYDGAVALGCVIRGETIHFEIVSIQSARGLMDFAIARRFPVGNGIITVDNEAQAWARARPEEGDKGGDAARAALAMGAAQTRNSLMAMPPKDERKANRRGAARLAAVQALYQMDLAGTGLNEIFAEFESHWLGREVEGEKYLPAEAAFFRDVVEGVVREQRRLDPLIDNALAQGWPLKRIEALMRAVLRAGAYELDHRRDVPARVVVTEYVDVAGAFVDRDETGMVNAVLDQLARQMRAGEFDRATG
jgi:N utilization substance protein B